MIKLELNHLLLSKALGRPVGLIKTQMAFQDQFQSLTFLLESETLQIESLIDEQYRFMFHQVLKDFKPDPATILSSPSLRAVMEANVRV